MRRSNYVSRVLSKYNKKELIYVPWGADKGDCPYCKRGVLRRDDRTENMFNVLEGYTCNSCENNFTEVAKRYFYKKY